MTDKEWQAHDDARTLARAEEIKLDPNKMAAAKIAAGKIVAEESKRLQGLRKVSGKKIPEVKDLSIPSVQQVVDYVGSGESPAIGGMKFGIGSQPETW